MSSPLSIQGGLPPGAPQEAPQSSPTTPNTAAPMPKPAQLYVNPSYRFDPTVGLVVLEFHDSNGAISNSIPSQRLLEAYRTHQAIPPNEQPPPIPAAAPTPTPAPAATPAPTPHPPNGKTPTG